MFDREAALRKIQIVSRYSHNGYHLMVGDIDLSVRKIDEGHKIYQISAVSWIDQYSPVLMFEVEEMTCNQAVDRFQEYLCQFELSDALFGWIGVL
jgi:hypothetical protein